MVIIKGHKISNKSAKDSIKAMENLIYFYKNRSAFETCPLCDMFIADDCDDCPWHILTNKSCAGNFFVVVSRAPKRCKKRIRQLYYWISIYKKALNDGGQI